VAFCATVRQAPATASAPQSFLGYGFFKSSGSFAFIAIRRVSSRVNSLAAESPAGFILEIDIGERLPVVVADDKAGVQFLDRPRRREADLI
jgi:hypothetical protein